MIQNKVVADLLQHRGDILHSAGKQFRVCGKHYVEFMQRHILSCFASLPDMPVILFNELLSDNEQADLQAYDYAFANNRTTFALPFNEFGMVTSTAAQLGVCIVSRLSPDIHVEGGLRSGNVNADGDCVSISLFAKMVGRPWSTNMAVCAYPYKDDAGENSVAVGVMTSSDMQLKLSDENIAVVRKTLDDIVLKTTVLIGRVNSQHNVIIRQPVPSTSGASLQAISKNKSLSEYHEVKLDSVPGYIYLPKGGTHASPRWHTRRGHWRKYRSGKQVWVRSTEVGDKKQGIVTHDYVVNT